MNSRTAVASAALLSVLALGGCASSGGSSGTGTTTVGGPGGSPTPTPSVSVPQTTPSPSVQPAAAGDGCTLIDQTTAAQVLGADPGPGKASGGLGEDGGITKVDGCSYEAAGSHLGYDVLVLKSVPPTQMLKMAQAKLKAQAGSGGAKQFDAGLADSLGFTFKVGSGVDSEIAVVAGEHWVTVAVSRKDGDASITKAQAIAAAQAITSAL